MSVRTKWLGAALLALVAVAVIAAEVPGTRKEHQPAEKGPMLMHATALRSQVSSALAAVEAAEKAVQAGDKDQALAQLAEAKRVLVAARHHLAPPAEAPFVNARCPIMGSPIQPDKVPAALVREYKGQKVAFCCGGCPVAWEKLSDAEKDAKLAAAGAAPAPAPAKGKFLNARCPIMGSPIDPARVAPNLIRDYNGGKVAFCCAGCPAAWDKLTDAERAARLKAAGGAGL